jgi:hypothetical protein
MSDVIQTFNDTAANEFLSPEVLENQISVIL